LNWNFRQLLPIYVTLVIWTVAWAASVNGPVMPLYVESLGIGILGWSLLAASAALGMFILEWMWGALYDRVDGRLLMILSVLCMSVLFPLYTIQGFIPYFLILQFLTGALGVGAGPITRAYVSNKSSKESVGMLASLWWAFYILGRTIGPLLGAFIAQVWSFQDSFYASALLSLATVPLILTGFPGKDMPQRKGSLNIVRGLKSALQVRSMGFLFMAALFAFMGASLIRSFLPLYASEQVKMSTLEVGVLISATSAAQLIAMPMLGWASDRFGRNRTVLLGFCFTSMAFLLFFLVRDSSQLMLVSLVVSVGLSASSMLLLSLTSDVASNKSYGTVVGVYGSFEDAGVILGPLVFGFIWSTYTPVLIFAAGAITQLVGALFIVPIMRKPHQRESL
jgi:DHA1 family multidrug resistance protein-like MFS transporter